MIKIVSESSVNLREREVRVLQMNFFGTVSVSKVVENDFNNFHVSVVNPCHARFIHPNVATRSRCNHAMKLRQRYFQNNNVLDQARIDRGLVLDCAADGAVARRPAIASRSDLFNGALVECGKRSPESRHVVMILVEREQHAIGLPDDLLPLCEAPET